ncbi:hypothetical protein F5Y13DRAFT_204961 [Hypoxylon sp. FL1857]|nr:hypothetical protein F5Y13DRAFT_204961 [Hypoxylon sp. FL1857]
MSAQKQGKTVPIPESEFTGVYYSWREQHLREIGVEAAVRVAAVSARGEKTTTTTTTTTPKPTITTTPSKKHAPTPATASPSTTALSTPTPDPLIANRSHNRSNNEEHIRLKLELDWIVSFDPRVAPARLQAAGSTVFHSPYFSSASGAAAWADSAEWPWSQGGGGGGERRKWYRWQEEPEKEEGEVEVGEDEHEDEQHTASTASSFLSSSTAHSYYAQGLLKDGEKNQRE